MADPGPCGAHSAGAGGHATPSALLAGRPTHPRQAGDRTTGGGGAVSINGLHLFQLRREEGRLEELAGVFEDPDLLSTPGGPLGNQVVQGSGPLWAAFNPSQRRLSPADIDDFIETYQEGATIGQLAAAPSHTTQCASPHRHLATAP